MDSGSSAESIGFIIYLVLVVVNYAAMWMVFTKAGQPGWFILIPLFNVYVMLLVAGKPGWWIVLMFIPFVNIIIFILMAVGVATNFGKGAGFIIGIILLPFIFYPILAFGDAQYQGAQPQY